MEYVVLSNGVKMPKLGFGVFQISRDETIQCTNGGMGSICRR